MQLVSGNLSSLGLSTEQTRLKDWARDVEVQQQAILKARQLISEIDVFLRANTVRESTPLRHLFGVQGTLKRLEGELSDTMAREIPASKADLEAARQKLDQHHQACSEQTASLRESTECVQR